MYNVTRIRNEYMESLRRKLNENCAYYIVNDERLDKNENLVQEVKFVEYR